MKELEAQVRAIEMDGLRWAGSELVPIGYGIKKLRIISVIVDDLVSTDVLRESKAPALSSLLPAHPRTLPHPNSPRPACVDAVQRSRLWTTKCSPPTSSPSTKSKFRTSVAAHTCTHTQPASFLPLR
jgi:hypothetical protein